MKSFTMLRTFGMKRLAILSSSVVFLLAVGGCSNGGAVPTSNDQARAALESALKTWRDGGKPGAIAGMEPAVQVSDTPWSKGDRLGSYEIVKEDTSGAEKKFTVRLSLTKPDRVEEVQYYVMGTGPVMVFRDQDYQRNINMEDGPATNKPEAKKTLLKRR
jgi:hypothetical protein